MPTSDLLCLTTDGIYYVDMPHTDENRRGLQAVLGYMLDRAVPAREIYEALKISRNTYTKRSQEDDFPNAEECRLIAEHFDLNPLGLLVSFGLISDQDVERFRGGDHFDVGRRAQVMTTIPRTGDRRPDENIGRAPRLRDLGAHPHRKL